MQTPDNDQHREDEPLQAPPRLVAELKRLPQRLIFIPRTLDEGILAAARCHLARRQGPKWKLFFPWIATAAALVLLVAIIQQFHQQSGSTGRAGGRFALEDVNHDGRVDILDAFALARQLKAGGAPNLQLDLNHDGVVDERDVATLASRAVQLPKGGRS